jgi:DNA-binding transcriptional LysR family regulator
VTLTQLGAFVLVARLGSVRAAASALGVSEPAVSQALAALRRHLGDDLIVRDSGHMTLTEGGRRLIPIASQMVNLGAEAEAAIRTAHGAPEQLRIVTEPVIAEFVAPGVVDAFIARSGSVEASVGVAAAAEMAVLLEERLADVAIGPSLASERTPGVESIAVFKTHLVVVASPAATARARGATWLIDGSGNEEGSVTAQLLDRLGVPERQRRVYPSQSAAWAAAAAGDGLAPALSHLVQPELVRGTLRRIDVPGTPAEVRWYLSTLTLTRRSPAAGSFRQFCGTPPAMRLMHSPGRGVPPRRFRPPVYVTIWS